MSENKNIVVQQNNRTDYDILFLKNNSWEKEEVAIAETFQKYGLDANAIPKDLFDYLISQIKSEYGRTYIWKKWKWNLNINRDEPDPSDIIYTDIPDGSTVYIAQFSSVQVVRDGTYIGTPIQIFSKKRTDYFDFPPRYYYSSPFKTRQEAENAPPVCYGGYNTEGNVDTGMGKIGYSGKNLTLKNFILLSNRTTKIDESTITSSNPNAYSEINLPDAEGYFYQKDGEILPPTFGQVYNSYYIGTGTSGSSYKMTITCSGNPRLVFIRSHEYGGAIGIFVYPSQAAYGIQTNSSSEINVEWGDNFVSWYTNAGNSNYQLNSNNSRYDFVVIQVI